jgi:hypothetical protein
MIRPLLSRPCFACESMIYDGECLCHITIVVFVNYKLLRVCYVYWSLCSRPSFAVSDYYQFDDLLNNEEQSIGKKVRAIMEKEIAPIMTVVCNV